jgi:hypothetical protein
METKRCERAAAGRRWATLEDAKLAAALSAVVDVRVDDSGTALANFCHRLESIRSSISASDLERVRRAAERVIGGSTASFERRALALEAAAGAGGSR